VTSNESPSKAAAKPKAKKSKGASDTTGSAGTPSGARPAAPSDSDSGIVWKSGDWHEPPDTTRPYNGIKMTAMPVYDEQGTLASLTLIFADFTNNSDGEEKSFPMSIMVGSTVELSVEGDFTISGIVELCSFQSVLNNFVVFFQDIVSYGLENQRHHVIGGVLFIPQTGTAAQAAPQTETTASDSPAPDDGSSEDGGPQDSKTPAKSPAKSESPEGSQE